MQQPPPWTIRPPLAPHAPSPLVFASPHSGRHYPVKFLAQARISAYELRRAEDALVDTLLDGVAAAAIPVLAARFARAYVDVNRDPAELDPAMFDPPLAVAALRASDRVAAGLGAIPRSVGPGGAIYGGPLPAAEAAARLAEVHAPWHTELATRLAAARARHGYAILVDCHSMPSQAGGNPPAIVIGDLQGRAAAPALVGWVARWFEAERLSVAINAPYAGAYALERHGAPWAGVHGIQIEIDRALYLDQARLLPTRGFAAMAARMTRFAAALGAAAGGLELVAPLPVAAE